MIIRIQNKLGKSRVKIPSPNLARTKKIVQAILHALKLQNAEIGIFFLSAEVMARHNRKFLKRFGATDVISFPVGFFPKGKTRPIGDVLICPAVVNKHAIKHHVSREQELARVIIHGILHLVGYDHDIPARKIVMKKKENFLLRKISVQVEGLWA